MKKLLIVGLVIYTGWYFYQQIPEGPASIQASPIIEATSQYSSASSQSFYRCDGRTHCSQMTSCEEATYFIRNCLSTEMDGDSDGIPCESQWCGR
jgi:hypothetical protein